MRTIRQQLTRKLLLGFGLLLGCGGVAVYFLTRAALLDQFDETLRTKANAISSATEQRGKRITVELSEQLMRESDERVAEDFFHLRRMDGTTVRRSKSLADADLPSRFGTFERPRYWNLTLPPGFRGRAIGYTFSPRHSREGEPAEITELAIVVASDRRELDETLATLALVLAASGALLLVATTLIVPRVLRRELAPLDQLAEQAGRINADSLSTRFPADSVPGELKPISERLNNLLSRLEQSFERERQFSADLAHELRTPIAELRSLADLALKWPETRPAETDRDSLAIAVQMEGIVVRLLELLRSERGQLAIARESILLAPLAEKVWQPFAERAAEKRLDVVRNVPDDAEIQSDPVLLRSILTNLIDNAAEYTPRGGTVRIDAGVGCGRFTVRVSNTIEHLEPADLTRFFDRFWRKDPARSGAKHSGLGLSLARAFAQALGCELTATIDGESRLVLTLSGPAAPAPMKPASVQS
jgi:two-component system sensor histidine kinase QseC